MKRAKIIGLAVVSYMAYALGLAMLLEAAAFAEALLTAGFHFSRAMLIYNFDTREHMTVGQMGAIGAALGFVVGLFTQPAD